MEQGNSGMGHEIIVSNWPNLVLQWKGPNRYMLKEVAQTLKLTNLVRTRVVRFRTSKLRAWAVPSEVQLELNLTIPERLWSRHSCFWAFSAYLGTVSRRQDVKTYQDVSRRIKTYQDVSRRTRISSDFVFSALLPSP